MKTKLGVRLFQKTLIALALMFLFMSTFSISSIYASPNAIETDPRRLTMLGIAEQYANYTWTATQSNVWHPSTSYGSGQTLEPAGIYPPPHPINIAAAQLIAAA